MDDPCYDCDHPRQMHDDDGPCLVRGCICGQYSGQAVLYLTQLADIDGGQ